MTALAVAGVIAAGGAAEVGHAVIAVLTVAATVTGALVMLGAALWGALYAFGRRQQRLYPPDPPNPVPDVCERGFCLWCDTRECLNRALCNCTVPCGSWLCVVKEATGA